MRGPRRAARRNDNVSPHCNGSFRHDCTSPEEGEAAVQVGDAPAQAAWHECGIQSTMTRRTATPSSFLILEACNPREIIAAIVHYIRVPESAPDDPAARHQPTQAAKYCFRYPDTSIFPRGAEPVPLYWRTVLVQRPKYSLLPDMVFGASRSGSPLHKDARVLALVVRPEESTLARRCSGNS